MIYLEPYEYMIVFIGIMLSLSFIQIHFILPIITILLVLCWLVFAPRSASGFCGVVVYQSRYEGFRGKSWMYSMNRR